MVRCSSWKEKSILYATEQTLSDAGDNRCDLLSLDVRCGREMNRLSQVQQIKGSGKYNKKTLNRKQNKIIILEDSHARGCAEAVQHNLGHGF